MWPLDGFELETPDLGIPDGKLNYFFHSKVMQRVWRSTIQVLVSHAVTVLHCDKLFEIFNVF
jgi:hypothetical protein